MPHDHGLHAHGAPHDATRLWRALVLIVIVMAGEIVAGVIAHSLALLSDAGHMLTDAGALGFSLLAIRLAARPAAGALTFGFRRLEILSAQANGVTLLVVAAFIVFEAIHRLVDPPHVRAGLVLGVAVAGAVLNIVAAWQLARADRSNLNIEGSFQHVVTDLYGFLGTAFAAGVILIFGFQRADPIASLAIAGLMIRSGSRLVWATGRIFLEAAPAELDPDQVGRALVALPAVVEVHDLHVWEVSSGFPALSAHVLVGREADCHRARREMEALLHERFGLEHTTLQVDHAGAELLEIAPGPS
jgi:cobalt-zinc-cadmium efflux system protein